MATSRKPTDLYQLAVLSWLPVTVLCFTLPLSVSTGSVGDVPRVGRLSAVELLRQLTLIVTGRPSVCPYGPLLYPPYRELDPVSSNRDECKLPAPGDGLISSHRPSIIT